MKHRYNLHPWLKPLLSAGFLLLFSVLITSHPVVSSAVEDSNPVLFTVNIPAIFRQNITATNILYSLNGGTGFSVTSTQTPTLTNTGVLSLQGETGKLSLTAGDGIALEGLKIINTGIKSLSASSGISVDGNKITNSGIVSLIAGEGISVSGNTITNNQVLPDYTLSGWTKEGSLVSLTNPEDTVDMNTVTFGNALITNGKSIIPGSDLSVDLGSSALRFDSLYVANINSNSSQSFSGQTTFSYPPQDSTKDESTVLINPAVSSPSGQLLGLSVNGFQKAFFDIAGNLTLGYSGLASAPVTSNPLNIYGHSDTLVASFDTNGNLTMGDTLTPTGGTLNIASNLNTQSLNVNSGTLSVTDKVGIGTTTPTQMLTVNGGLDTASLLSPNLINRTSENTRINFDSTTTSLITNGSTGIFLDSTGNVGIGTTTPGSYKLNVAGTTNLQGAVTAASSLNIEGQTTLSALSAGTTNISGSLTLNGPVNSVSGFLGLGTLTPSSQLDIQAAYGTSALSLTNTGNTILGMDAATNGLAMNLTTQDPTNKLLNGTFETGISNWSGTQPYILRDEFTDSGPTTLATATPVTIQSGGISNPTPTLGSELYDTNASTFEGTSTYAWDVYRSQIENDGNSLKNTYIDYSWGTTNLLRNSSDLSSDLITGSWYQLRADAKVSTGGTVTWDIVYPIGAIHNVMATITNTNFQTFQSAFRSSSTTGDYLQISGLSVGESAWLDNLSLKPLTLSSLFSTVNISSTATSTDYTVQTDVTLTAGTQAGLVMNLDSASTPNNFIIAYHDGTKIYLDKNVGGTYTNLINVSTSYIPGATIKVVKNGFNYSLYYNGVQKGTTQIITDSGIVNNTNHGVFSTYASNSFTNFLVQSQVSSPTPVLGSELVTNGNMETGNPPSNWTGRVSANLTGYADQRTGGTGSQSLNIVVGGNNYTSYQSITQSIGTWYQLSAWVKNITGTAPVRVTGLNGIGQTLNTTSASWVGSTISGRATGTDGTIYTIQDNSNEARFDDISLKPLTLSSLFSTINANNQNVVASTSATLTAGTQAGLVLNLDSVSNPQNFVIAYHDGTNMHLDKAVAGTYTSLINTATTYVAGANITVRKNGTRYTLVYNGTQVGTDQTISDAGIINNTIHGLFSTYSGNTFTNFSITTNLDGTYATDGVNARTVTDTNNNINISGQKLNVIATNSMLWYSSQARTTGKVLLGTITPQTGGATYANFGWTGSANSNAIYYGFVYRLANDRLYFYNNNGNGGGVAEIGPAVIAGTTYNLAVVFSTNGMYQFIKGGIYLNWTLVWKSINTGTKDLYPLLGSGPNITDSLKIPTSLWLPTPLAYDTFTATGSATTETTGPDNQTTPQLTWTGGTKAEGTMSITPTFSGENIVTNGSFDTDTDWTKGDSWTIANGVATKVAGSTSSSVSQNAILNIGNWYQTGFSLANHSDIWGFYMNYLGFVYNTINSNTSYLLTGRASSTNVSLFSNVAASQGDFDNVTAQPFTLSSLFSTVTASSSNVIADVTIPSYKPGTQAGLVIGLDNTSTPSKFLIAYLRGDGKAIVEQNVNGTYSTVVTASTAAWNTAYVLRVVKDGTAVRLYYNNALIGTGTCNASITGTNHGIFSTYSGNTFDNFTLWSRGTAGEYNDIPADDITVTQDTSIKRSGTASAKLVAGTSNANFLQSTTIGDTNTYTLTAYAFEATSSAVNTSDLELYYDGAVIPTIYADMGGGWYRLQGTITGSTSAKDIGVRVKAGKTVYLDNITLTSGTATPTTMYVYNSSTGKANLNVQGLVDGTLSGIATFSKAGTISDADFTSTASGMLAVDTLNHRLYFREGTGWSYIARTGGFQIPAEETAGLTEGDLLLPYVESKMSDGALHGLYTKLSDIMTGGTATISKYTDHVDVVFNKPFFSTPVINISLVNDSTEEGFLTEGHEATVTDLSPTGFSIYLSSNALRDYTYSWTVLQIPKVITTTTPSND